MISISFGNDGKKIKIIASSFVEEREMLVLAFKSREIFLSLLHFYCHYILETYLSRIFNRCFIYCISRTSPTIFSRSCDYNNILFYLEDFFFSKKLMMTDVFVFSFVILSILFDFIKTSYFYFRSFIFLF